MDRRPPPRGRHHELINITAVTALIGVVGAGVIGLTDSGKKEECNQPGTDLLDDALCGLGIIDGQPQSQSNPTLVIQSPTTSPSPRNPNVVPAPSSTVANVAPAPDNPFSVGWYTDPTSGHRVMNIGGRLVFYQFDDQWVYPPQERGGRCGENVYASGIAYLTGQFVSPVDIWTRIEAADGHSPTGSGTQSDRGRVAEFYGLQSREFNNLQEAEQYARALGDNAYMIIGQNQTSGDTFSPHGKHIIGLMWDPEKGEWKPADPNDYLNQDPGLGQLEPELGDNLRYWPTPRLAPGIYHIVVWTNPNGRQPGPWEA